MDDREAGWDYDLLLRDSWRDRIHRAITPNPGDWAFVQLGEYLYPLYYLVRPIRLAVDRGKRLLGFPNQV